MKKHLLKTLLVATGLLAGTLSSWAQTTSSADVKMTYVDGESGNEEVSHGEIATGNTASTGYNKISGGAVNLAYSNWHVNYITYIQVDASKLEGKITNATLTLQVSGSTDSKRAATYGVGYNSSTWTDQLTYKIADKSITVLGNTQGTATKSAKTFETKTFDITDALKNDDDKIVTILVYATNAGGGYIKNPTATITTVPESAPMTSYTIKYVNEDGEEINNAITNDIAVGAETTATKKDMESFFHEGEKYIYKGGNTTIKAVEDASNNIITLTFRKAETWNYTIKCIAGNTTKEIPGQNIEGETFNVAYPYIINDNGTIYTTKKLSSDGKGYYFSFTLSENNMVKEIEYVATTKNNIVYFSEAEDIDGLTKVTSGNTAIRSSNGASAYAKDQDVEITNLPAGKYKLYASFYDATSTLGNEWNFLAGEKNIYTYTTKTVNWDEPDPQEFTLKEESPIILKQGGSNQKAIDFIYIQKVGEVASVSPAHYATYVTTDNVKVPANVKVLVATKVENNKLQTTELNEGSVIPANTAIIVNTEDDNVTFEMTDQNNNDFPNNDLKPSNRITANGKQYCLTQLTNGNVGFMKVKEGVEIPAGKAYLEVPEQSASANFFALDDTVTAIKNIETEKTEDNAYYTLQGVKVVNPTKGIYIHNGKKVVIK